MTDKSLNPPPGPRRVLATLGAVLAVVIISGSIIAAQQAGFSFASLSRDLGRVIGRIGGANLVVTTGSVKLPADGKSQTTITAKLINSQIRVTASIVSGDGQIARSESADGKTEFTYTAGRQIGKTSILVKAGSLEETVIIELAEAVKPATPQITDPPDGSEVKDPYPTISGTGPADTKILITNNGNSNTTTSTNDQGQFKVKLERSLYNGQHTLTAVAVSDLGVASNPSELVTITVTTNPITLDTANIRIVPQTILAGESFAVFVPTSLNTTKVLVEIIGQTYELFDYNKSSVFTNTLPAPDQPGVYVGNIVLVDAANNSSRFEKIIRISVTS